MKAAASNPQPAHRLAGVSGAARPWAARRRPPWGIIGP